MAADAEIQDYFKKISKTYENIQHYLDCANNAVIKNNAIDQEDEKKNIDKPLRVHNSNDINHLMADLEYVFPSNIQMCDLFNDPKETFKLRRTAVVQKSLSKYVKKDNTKKDNNEKKIKMVPNPPSASNTSNNKYNRRATSQGWEKELNNLTGSTKIVNSASRKSINNNSDNTVEELSQFNIKETITMFFDQNAFSKDKVVKLLETLWSVVEYTQKSNYYCITGTNIIKKMRSHVKDRSHRPSLEERIVLAFDPNRLGKISLYYFIFCFTYYNNKLKTKEKIEIISILCMCKYSVTDILQPRQILMSNILSLIYGKQRQFKQRIEKSIRFMHKIQMQQPESSVDINVFAEIIKSDTQILELFQPTTNDDVTIERATNPVLEAFMKRRQLTWSSLNSLWNAISSTAENAAMIMKPADENMMFKKRNVWQERSYLDSDDFNRILYTFLEPCEAKDGKLVRELSEDYINQYAYKVDCWTLVSNLATSLNMNDIKSGIFDLEAKLKFYFNFYDLDGNGDIDQKEFKTILMSHQSKLEKMAFIIGLELYGLTKVGELRSEGRNQKLLRSHNISALTKIFNIHSSMKMKNRKDSRYDDNDGNNCNQDNSVNKLTTTTTTCTYFDILCELVKKNNR